jgi:hypothetical protein
MNVAHILLGNDDIPRDRDMLDLYQGFLELGYKINFYKSPEVIAGTLKVEPADIFCGTIPLCRMIWRSLDVTEPKIPDYPDELQKFLKRRIELSTLGNFRKTLFENDYNGLTKEYFIKPVKTKLFTGDIYQHLSQLEKYRYEIGADTPIYVSTPINFNSEYRVYVHQKKIIGVHHYFGRWDYFPNPDTIKEMVELINPIMPISYSVDVGILSDNTTALVECNDGYALGNYGLDSKNYAAMIRDRWLEITKRINYEKSISDNS